MRVESEIGHLRDRLNGEALHPDEVNQILLEQAKTFRHPDKNSDKGPLDTAPTAQPLWQLHSRRQIAMQNLRREEDPISKLARSEHLKNIQQSLDEASKEHALQVKKKSQARLHHTLREVSDKVIKDPHSAYRSLKHVTPWAPEPKVCLRSSDGRILSEQEGLEELKKHSLSIFSSHPPLPAGTGTPLPSLDRKSLSKGIASIKPEKAVPQGSAPASMYRLCSSVVANNYCDYLESTASRAPSAHQACEVASSQELTSQHSAENAFLLLPTLPSTTKSADLSFIPKPSKPASKPENLRPLGIIRPDGKGIAAEARRRLDPLFKRAHFASPQFAYIPGRGIADAQLRVIGHAKRVRALLRSRAPDRFKCPKRGVRKPDLIGGFTFSLDLSQAFDKTSREALFAPLDLA